MPNLSRAGWSVSVSSTYSPSWIASYMVDGNAATAWSSESGYPHTITLDLGVACTFDSISFARAASFTSDFPTTVELYVSDDGVTWGSALATKTWPMSGGTEIIMLPRQTKRYVKIVGVSSTTGSYWACSELNLWIEQGLNRYSWTASATSHYDSDTDADRTIDGYSSENYSNFISDAGMPQSITVDMGSLQTINYIRVVEANVRFYNPIYWGQPLPKRVKAYVSVDNITWTLAKEMAWPGYGGTHWIEFPTSYVVRYFRFEATLVGGTYDRLAISEVYAGLLASGETYKYYHKARPQFFEIHQEAETEEEASHGWVDHFSGSPVVGKIRIWHTNPLAGDYPQVAMSIWDLPADWESLALESVSLVAEGQHLDSPEVVTVSEFNLMPAPFSWGGGGDDWFYGTGDIAPQVDGLVFTDAGGWLWGCTQATLPDKFSNMTIWNSISQSALSHDDDDVSRLLITDHYFLVVWERTYEPAYIAVNKVLAPSSDAGLFNLQIDGVTEAANVGNGGSTGAVEVSEGAHTVGETAGTGTNLALYTRSFGGDANYAGLVTAIAGQSKTAIIYNTRLASPPGEQPWPRPEAPHCLLNPAPGIEPDYVGSLQPSESATPPFAVKKQPSERKGT